MDQALSTNVNQPSELDQMLTMDAATSQAMYGKLMENVDVKAEVRISRLQIVQTTSPELKLKGYSPGQIMDATGKAIRTRRLRQPWLAGKVEEAERDMVECLPYLLVGKLPNEATKWYTQAQRDADPTLPKQEWKTLDFNEPRVREGVYKQWGGTWGTKERPDTIKQAPPVTVSQNFFLLPLTPQYDVDGSFRIQSCSRTSAPMGSWLATHLAERGAMSQVPWFYVLWMYTSSKPGKGGSTIYLTNSVVGVPLRETPNALRLHRLCKDMFDQLFMNEGGKELQLSLLGATADDHEDEPEEAVGGAAAAAPTQQNTSPTGEPSVDEF